MPTAPEPPTPEARTLMGRPFARPEGADEKPDIRKPGMGEVPAHEPGRFADDADLGRQIAAALPPLPRRLIAAKLRDDARVALQDAPRKLRGLADDDAEHFVGLEHDGLGGAVLVGPDEFRRWADAIEALLR